MTRAVDGRAEKKNWKLAIAYDGTEYHGWQMQPGQSTIQGALSFAIERVTGETVVPQGSGRTDAGVHALAQVASCALSAPVPEEAFTRALNRVLPSAIRILSSRHAPPEFHARHSARSKVYEYRIYRGSICPPWLARYIFAMDRPLDLDAMRLAASLITGTHDFTSFAASDPERSLRISGGEVHNVRTIFSSEWRQEGAVLAYQVRGSGFLHHMVRNLVGAFLLVGRGRLMPEEIPRILAARSRAAAGPTAPARGLFLAGVDYGSPTNTGPGSR